MIIITIIIIIVLRVIFRVHFVLKNWRDFYQIWFISDLSIEW